MSEHTAMQDDIRELTARLRRTEAERDNATRMLNEQAEAMKLTYRENAELKKVLQVRDDMQATIDQVNRLTADQFRVTIEKVEKVESGITRAAAIRNRQFTKGHTIEHDRETHGARQLAQAGAALALGHLSRWPWKDAEYGEYGEKQFYKLCRDPDRYAHASALLAAADDIRDTPFPKDRI
jgi:hypothetical protein